MKEFECMKDGCRCRSAEGRVTPAMVAANRRAVGLPPLPRAYPPAFLICDSHKGGEHRSRGLYVGPYFDHPARVVACTWRSKRGRVCGALGLEFEEE